MKVKLRNWNQIYLINMEAQIEEAIKFRKKANFKILTRLSQIIDQYPYLRFHQILMIYKISEVDKFNEESVETLKKLEHEMVEKGISKITSNSSDGNNTISNQGSNGF